MIELVAEKEQTGKLIDPYGGHLVNLLVEDPQERQDLLRRASELTSIQVSERCTWDLEMLATGGFSPASTFTGQADLESILESMRLCSGFLFPIPTTLAVGRQNTIRLDSEVALRDPHNDILAILRIEEAYEWDRLEFARRILATTDPRHPLVAELDQWGEVNLSGTLRVLRSVHHYDFVQHRLTPAQTREGLLRMGRQNVVAFQTRNPLHRAHEEMTKRAMQDLDASLLLHPAVGMTRSGDVDHFTRVRTYEVMTRKYYPPERVLLGLVPLAMRMAGPREALWHAIIRRNYGANAFIVGREHASPGIDSAGRPFYSPEAAQNLVAQHAHEIGVQPKAFAELVYLPDEGRYEERTRVASGRTVLSLSGSEVRDRLRAGQPLPEWFTRPEVASILAEAHPPARRQGFCVWFTGLSGAGKSATAEALTSLLLESGRQVTLLDGDVVRTHLSSDLGFSKQDRDTNIRRIGFLAAEIVRHRGAVIAAAVSPYRAVRDEVRNFVGNDSFFEIFVDTPLEVCESRDSKGMYARARRGELRGFTGIDDPYEPPLEPQLRLCTVGVTIEENARRIVNLLQSRGLVP